jgi:hypothetical protein
VNPSGSDYCKKCGGLLSEPLTPDFGLKDLTDYQSEIDHTLSKYLKETSDSIAKDLSELSESDFVARNKRNQETLRRPTPSGQENKRSSSRDSSAPKQQAHTDLTAEFTAFLKALGTSNQLSYPDRQMELPLAKATTVLQLGKQSSSCQITIDHTDWINFAQHHAGVSPIRYVKIVNNQIAPLESLRLEISVLPDEYGPSWQQSIGRLRRGETWEGKNIRLSLSKERLRSITETESANLQFKLSTDDRVIHVHTTPVSIHPMYQFLYTDGTEIFLATYVTPNKAVIKEVINTLARRLEAKTKNSSLDGYQTRKPARVFEMIQTVHDVLVHDYEIKYINPPPGGGYDQKEKAILQNVRPLEDVIKNKRGTCLDLSILLAALLEAIGLNPIVLLIPGHAFNGCWTVEKNLENPVIEPISQQEYLTLIREDIETGRLVLFNSTTLCKDSNNSFQDAQKAALAYFGEIIRKCQLKQEAFIKFIDIKACRDKEIRSLP